MARRRFKRAGFNTKLITDIGLAGIGVRILPSLLNKFVPLDPTLYTVAGAGLTYVAGSMLKKPDMANAGIALGLVEFVAPMIENLVGGITGSPVQQIGVPSGVKVIDKRSTPPVSLTDYLNLNDYISTPGIRQGVDEYRSSY